MAGIVAVAAVAAAAVAGAAASGMSVHNEVARRGSLWFRSAQYPEYEAIATEFPSYFQPGAFFPDWGFSCGNFGNEAEDGMSAGLSAHWPQFYNASADHIRETYQRPWTLEVQQLIAFVFGLIGHAGADTPWHSLGHNGGLIQSMEYTEFGQDYQAAHTRADIGGEFVLKHAGDLDYVEREWLTPAEDMAAIYARTGRTAATPEDISFCMQLGFLGIWANRLAGEVLFAYNKDSPVLVQNVQNYFLSGLNDAATWTQLCWGDFVRWLETDTPRRPMCLVFDNHWSRGPNPKDVNDEGFFSNPEQAAAIVRAHGFEVVSALENGVASARLVRTDGQTVDEYLRKLDAAKEMRAHLAANPRADAAAAVDCASVADVATRAFATNEPLAQLGKALASGDFNADGEADLAIGAPFYVGVRGNAQRGAVFVVNSAGTTTDAPAVEEIELTASRSFVGPEEHGRFGYSLAVVDLNRDGVDDLAVGAPTVGMEQFYYDGRVHIFFGSASGLSESPDVTIAVAQLQPEFDPNSDYRFKYTNFGEVLLGADVDGDGFADLVVGAPHADPDASTLQRGRAYVYLAASALVGTIDSTAAAALRFEGDTNYQYFGASVAFGVVDGVRMLFVGAPAFKVGQGAEAVHELGKVLAFDVARGSNAAPIFSIQGTSQYQQLGSDLAVVTNVYGDNRTHLLIGASTEYTADYWFAGVVRTVDVSGLVGAVSIEDVDVQSTLVGEQNGGQFGWGRVAVAGGRLWTAEPFFGTIRSDEAKLETGRLFSYDLGPTFPRNGTVAEPASASASACILGDAPKGRFGATIAALPGTSVLAVASPQSYLQSRLSGAVYLVPI